MPVSADLGETLEDVVNNLVKSGRYHSKSEVLREGVRLVQEREAKLADLMTKLQAGIGQADRGELIPAEEVFAELKADILSGKIHQKNAS